MLPNTQSSLIAQQFISLIKFRRGLKEQRLTTKFQEGEPLFETDTRRLFIGIGDNDKSTVGTGTTGGILVSNLTFNGPLDSNPTSTTEPRAYSGDLMYANSKLWRLGDGGWVDIAPKTDNNTISYNNKNELYVLPSAFTVVAGPGITIEPGNIISITNRPDNPLDIVNGELTLGNDSITGNLISQSCFDRFQFTKIGETWSLNLNNVYFDSTSDIQVQRIDAGQNSDFLYDVSSKKVGSGNAIISSRFNEISSNQSNSGLAIDSNRNLVVSDSLITKNDKIVRDINPVTSSIIGSKISLDNFLIADYGVPSTYNGSISADDNMFLEEPAIPSFKYTVFNCDKVASMTPFNMATITSAGFVVLSNDSGLTKNNKRFKKFAIPVYALPDSPESFIYSNIAGSCYIRGFNLEGASIYIQNIDGSKVIIPIIENNLENNILGFKLYCIKWANPITIPTGATLHLLTISDDIQVDITNPPVIALAKNDTTGTETNPIPLIQCFNTGTVASAITVKAGFDNVSTPEVTLSLTDAQITTSLYDFVSLKPTFNAPVPTWTSLAYFTVTVGDKTARYDLKDL